MPSTVPEQYNPRRRGGRRLKRSSPARRLLTVATGLSVVVILAFFADKFLNGQTAQEPRAARPSSSATAPAAGAGLGASGVTPPADNPAEPPAAPLAQPEESPTAPLAQPVAADEPPDPAGVSVPPSEKEELSWTANESARGVVPENIDEIAVAEGKAVDSGWFSDAVLIGDSRVDGFRLYSGASEADYIVRAGMSVYEVDKEKQNISVGGAKHSVYQLLGRKQYAKVYLSIGINELGYYDPKGYAETYKKIIDRVSRLQPDAQIYVMTLIPVNAKVCKENNQRSYINNDLIRQYNTALVEMAAAKDVLLINAAEALAGEDGELLEEMTSDGVHFIKDGYAAWRDYLLCHTGT